MTNKKTISYMFYSIIGIEDIEEEKRFIHWELFFNSKFILQDYITIDGGGSFQSLAHAINDAKKNIDTFYRLKINNVMNKNELRQFLLDNSYEGHYSGHERTMYAKALFCRNKTPEDELIIPASTNGIKVIIQ